MSVYIPFGQFVINWSRIDRITVYCPATYVVNATTLFPTIEFIDITNPLQPGYITVSVFDLPFQSNSVTLDHIITRAWYVASGVEYDWNDWQTEFYIDPIDKNFTIRLAVYSFAQLGYTHVMPPVPSEYWFQRPFRS